MMRLILLLSFFSSLALAEIADVHKEVTFTYCDEAKPSSFNPQLATDDATFNASARTMYNRLVEIERTNSRVIPGLAESWDVSPDGRQFTFKLRKNVQFHTTDYFKPTRNFNADDVIFSFERMRDPNHPFHAVGGGIYPNFVSQQLGTLIDNIERVDDQTVRFSLRRPAAPFLANLAMDFASILSAEYGAKLIHDKKLANMDNLPIGTGPFQFVWYDTDKNIRYKANAGYFGERPQIDNLVFQIVPDPTARLAKLKSGECQFISNPRPIDMVEIRKDPNLKLMSQPGMNISYIALNVERSPFSNILVRKAIYYALNRENYIKMVYGGTAQLAKNPLPPTLWSYNRYTPDYDYNTTKAKDLLRQAGLADGFEAELYYAAVSRPYNPDPQKMVDLIKADLAAVGIKIRLVKLEWQDFLKKTRAGEPSMSLQGWTSDNGDPDNFLNELLSCSSIPSGNNRAHWCNQRYSFLVDRAQVTTNIRVRTQFYEEAQVIFKRETPWVTIAHGTVFKAARKTVQGYHMSPFGIDDFSTVFFK
jgi:dipeptide transport system substrate-binding protein